uniref:Uncharacterized protein n=1 Tax=Cacopsylla melanoneura TaxID=428564 RepID=A0A8D8YCA5_9HEMI
MVSLNFFFGTHLERFSKSTSRNENEKLWASYILSSDFCVLAKRTRSRKRNLAVILSISQCKLYVASPSLRDNFCDESTILIPIIRYSNFRFEIEIQTKDGKEKGRGGESESGG